MDNQEEAHTGTNTHAMLHCFMSPIAVPSFPQLQSDTNTHTLLHDPPKEPGLLLTMPLSRQPQLFPSAAVGS